MGNINKGGPENIDDLGQNSEGFIDDKNMTPESDGTGINEVIQKKGSLSFLDIFKKKKDKSNGKDEFDDFYDSLDIKDEISDESKSEAVVNSEDKLVEVTDTESLDNVSDTSDSMEDEVTDIPAETNSVIDEDIMVVLESKEEQTEDIPATGNSFFESDFHNDHPEDDIKPETPKVQEIKAEQTKTKEDKSEILDLGVESEQEDKKSKKSMKSLLGKIFKKDSKTNIETVEEPIQPIEQEKNDTIVNSTTKTIISNDSGTEDIFQELQNLNFENSDTEEDIEKRKIKEHPIFVAYKISTNFALLSIFLIILLTVDIYLKTTNDNYIVSALPVCPYLSWSIDGYDNTDCKTLPMIVTSLQKEKSDLEKNIVSNLHALLPRKLETDNISNSPEVQFIQEKTGDSRIYIKNMLEKFDEIRMMSPYKGEDIECSSLTLNEKGEMDISCDVYGGSIFSQSTSLSSRITAIKFLENLRDKNNGFMVLDFPKTIGISKFISGDGGIKGAFTTKTTLLLKLKFIYNNKM
ncbi:MAG: hypothetical protein PHS92_02315 [Candidatus Gracilibacteria bacterium]|nr:hypothetical protein [Candidatus Gracilibacteria bacterium]